MKKIRLEPGPSLIGLTRIKSLIGLAEEGREKGEGGLYGVSRSSGTGAKARKGEGE